MSRMTIQQAMQNAGEENVEVWHADYTDALLKGIRGYVQAGVCFLDLTTHDVSSLAIFESQHGYQDNDLKITWRDINPSWREVADDYRTAVARIITTRDFIDTDRLDLRDPNQISGAAALLSSKAAWYGECLAQEVDVKYGPLIEGMTVFQFEPIKLMTLGIINDGITHRMVFDHTFRIGFKE